VPEQKDVRRLWNVDSSLGERHTQSNDPNHPKHTVPHTRLRLLKLKYCMFGGYCVGVAVGQLGYTFLPYLRFNFLGYGVDLLGGSTVGDDGPALSMLYKSFDICTLLWIIWFLYLFR
jgi:hypothetical protein